MSSTWIQAALVIALLLIVLAIVFWSMCVAAHRADQAMEEEETELAATQRESDDPASTSTANIVLAIVAFCVLGAAQAWLPGPSASQAAQDIADEVNALEAQAEAERLPARHELPPLHRIVSPASVLAAR